MSEEDVYWWSDIRFVWKKISMVSKGLQFEIVRSSIYIYAILDCCISSSSSWSNLDHHHGPLLIMRCLLSIWKPVRSIDLIDIALHWSMTKHWIYYICNLFHAQLIICLQQQQDSSQLLPGPAWASSCERYVVNRKVSVSWSTSLPPLLEYLDMTYLCDTPV